MKQNENADRIKKIPINIADAVIGSRIDRINDCSLAPPLYANQAKILDRVWKPQSALIRMAFSC